MRDSTLRAAPDMIALAMISSVFLSDRRVADAPDVSLVAEIPKFDEHAFLSRIFIRAHDVEVPDSARTRSGCTVARHPCRGAHAKRLASPKPLISRCASAGSLLSGTTIDYGRGILVTVRRNESTRRALPFSG